MARHSMLADINSVEGQHVQQRIHDLTTFSEGHSAACLDEHHLSILLISSPWNKTPTPFTILNCLSTLVAFSLQSARMVVWLADGLWLFECFQPKWHHRYGDNLLAVTNCKYPVWTTDQKVLYTQQIYRLSHSRLSIYVLAGRAPCSRTPSYVCLVHAGDSNVVDLQAVTFMIPTVLGIHCVSILHCQGNCTWLNSMTVV